MKVKLGHFSAFLTISANGLVDDDDDDGDDGDSDDGDGYDLTLGQVLVGLLAQPCRIHRRPSHQKP